MDSFCKTSLIDLAETHWKEYLPEKYAKLEKTNQLIPALHLAADRTIEEMNHLKELGMSEAEAWSEVRALFILLTPEDDDDEDEEVNEAASLAVEAMNLKHHVQAHLDELLDAKTNDVDEPKMNESAIRVLTLLRENKKRGHTPVRRNPKADNKK